MGLVTKALSARQLGTLLLHRSSSSPLPSNPVARLATTSRAATTLAFFQPRNVNAGVPPQQQRQQQQKQPQQRTTRMMMSTSSTPNGQEIAASLASSASSQQREGQHVEWAMECLAKANAVCFDVDSTVIAEEGIDVLADFLGHGHAVAALTRQAMEGDQKFQDALQERLDLMRPSQQAILQCLNESPLQLSPGIDDLVQALAHKGIDVYLVSGGFRIMIEPVAEELGISKDRIVANTILFDESGNYTGFDPTEPTSADMGKPKALAQIKQSGNYQTMVMVGDGATDAQAKPPADAFIGYGGVVVRPAVQGKADWFVKDFNDMIAIVNKYGGS